MWSISLLMLMLLKLYTQNLLNNGIQNLNINIYPNFRPNEFFNLDGYKPKTKFYNAEVPQNYMVRIKLKNRKSIELFIPVIIIIIDFRFLLIIVHLQLYHHHVEHVLHILIFKKIRKKNQTYIII